MSWSITERGTFTRSYESNNWTSASFVPDANALLLLVLYEVTLITGVSGHDGGASWVQVYYDYLNSERLEVWGCFTPSSPSADTVTVTLPYEAKLVGTLLEIQESVNGVDISGTVGNAFGTPDHDEGYNITTPQIVLAPFADVNNMSFVLHFIRAASATVTVEAGFTALNSVTNPLAIYPYYKGSEENTIDGTCEPYLENGFWGIEIKQGSGGGSSNLKKLGDTDIADIGSVGGVPIGDIKKIGDEDI